MNVKAKPPRFMQRTNLLWPVTLLSQQFSGLASPAGGWQTDGFHVYPGESIQQAMEKAKLNPTNKVVYVHAGVYRPETARQALIWFNATHDGLHVEAVGDVTLTAANEKFSNSGEASHPAVVNHIVYFGDGISSNTVLQGFKITGAKHFVTRTEPELEPNTRLKKDLFFYGDGGAIKIFGTSYPSLRQLRIVDNYASPCAGGISIQHLKAANDAGQPMVLIEDCVFRGNRSQVTGAAVDLLPGSSAVIRNCLFVGNVANQGVNYISANQAAPEFTNSAPVTVFPRSRAIVQHCTFTGNRNAVEDLGGNSIYSNCIFWRNDLEGAFYAGTRYELNVEAGGRVSACVFGGGVVDPHGVILRSENNLEGTNPEFDAELQPACPAYQHAGFRLKSKL